MVAKCQSISNIKIDKKHTQASNDIRVSMLSSRERKEARKLHTTDTRNSVSTLMVMQCTCTFMFTNHCV